MLTQLLNESKHYLNGKFYNAELNAEITDGTYKNKWISPGEEKAGMKNFLN